MPIDLRSIAQNAVETVWGISESIAVAGTYHRLTPGAYVPATGVTAAIDQTFPISARTGVFTQKEIDGAVVQAGDKKILVRTSEMGLEPTKNDYIIETVGGKRFDLFQLGTEPTGKLLIFRGRAHAK